MQLLRILFGFGSGYIVLQGSRSWLCFVVGCFWFSFGRVGRSWCFVFGFWVSRGDGVLLVSFGHALSGGSIRFGWRLTFLLYVLGGIFCRCVT